MSGRVLTKGLDHLGKIAYDSGMKIVYIIT